MKKKILSILLVLIMLFSCAACGGGGGEGTGGGTQPSNPVDTTYYGSSNIQTFSYYTGTTLLRETGDGGFVYSGKVLQLFNYFLYLTNTLGLPTSDQLVTISGTQYNMNKFSKNGTVIELLMSYSYSQIASGLLDSASVEVIVYPSAKY